MGEREETDIGPPSGFWYQAINLNERLALLRAHPAHGETVPFISTLAASRLQHWRAQPQFPDEPAFDRRLAMDGMDMGQFQRILGEPAESVRVRAGALPWWLSFIACAYAAPAAATGDAPLPASMRAQPLARALVVIDPLVRHARGLLRSDIDLILDRQPVPAIDTGRMEALLFEGLPSQLLAILSRTLVLELHVARLRGELSGSTSAERFDSFIAHLCDPDYARRLLHEYPVLVRQVVVCLANWRAAGRRFVQDLACDWQAICTEFPQAASAGPLTGMDAGAGDHHRGGRSVMLLTFAAGVKLVYKPRSLAVDVHFQQLLAWLNLRIDQCHFRILKVLDRGDHGWVEFVARATQVSEEQAQRYHRREGGYLALLYLLEATDFHYENLIAAGEHPVLIDLEALFQPRLQDEQRDEADNVAGRELNYSVLRVGLLPQRLFTDMDREGLDVSGMGAAANQVTPFDIAKWKNAGTDEMCLVRDKGVFGGSPNRLIVDGSDVGALRYAEDIVAGFSEVYGVFIRYHDELQSAGGPLAWFENDEVRVLVRATRTYARLLQESHHPDVLRDALDRDRLFDSLWTTADHLPQLPQVIAAERRELWNGDIPAFTTRPGARVLCTGDDRRIDDFFVESSLSLVRRQLRRLCDDDLARQTWFIRAALTTISYAQTETGTPKSAALKSAIRMDGGDPVSMAGAIGDRLAALSIRGARDASWIGLALVNGRTFDLAPLAIDLYDGLPGVALFLAYLGEITGAGRHTELSRAAVESLRSLMGRVRTQEKSVGAFTGWGGLVYLFTHLGMLWNQPDLLDEAESIAALLPDLIAGDRKFDIIGGAAGCIPSLLNLYRLTSSKPALRAAELCGQRLVAGAERQATGVGWMSAVPSHQPLAGFSHGAAGIAWSLLELAAVTGEQRLREHALAGIAYERTLYSRDAANWLDVRSMGHDRALAQLAPPKFQVAWCHGAPGIGLARLMSRRHLDDDDVGQEIHAALETTLKRGFDGSQCLCHGDLGNIELLLHAAEALPDARWREEKERRAQRIVASIARTGPICANPLGVESPGLMTGLAGIGYGLLRIAVPDRVPSVLALAAPPPVKGPRTHAGARHAP